MLTITPSARVAAAGADDGIDYRTLRWEDYPVRPVDSRWDAYWAFMSYRYTQTTTRENGGFRSEVRAVDVRCRLILAKSWRHEHMRDPDGTLLHEQGHFDICEAKARALRSQRSTRFPVGHGPEEGSAQQDLERGLEAYFAEHLAAIDRQHLRYDRETEHGLSVAQQRLWSMRLGEAVRGSPRR